MSILKTLQEQASISFTGRINILDKQLGQFLGVIHLRDGFILNCEYSKRHGKRAILTAIIHDMDDYVSFKLVVEPEIVEITNAIKLSVGQLNKLASLEYEKYNKLKKFKPPSDLRLVISMSLMSSDYRPNFLEFNLLKTISEYSQVDDIYNNSNLFEHEITEHLISLKKAGFIKVGTKELL